MSPAGAVSRPATQASKLRIIEISRDTKGRAKAAHGTFSLKRTKTGAAIFDAKLKKGSWADDWSDEGGGSLRNHP